jgi:hypothetical protein
MKKSLLSKLRIGMALFLAVFSSNLLPVAVASAAPQPWSEPTNHVEYWQNLGYGTCSKVDYPEDTDDTTYTMPSAQAGSAWTLLVIKAAQTNEVYTNPTVGATYNAPAKDNGNLREISHIITCVQSTPLTVPTAPVPTEPTCDAAGSLTLPADTADVHWTISPAYAGPGTYDVTATAQGGKVFVGGGTTVSFNDIVVAPQLTEDCEEEQITVTPVVPTVSDVCGTEDDEIIKPVDSAQITYSLTGNVVTATLVNPSTHDFAAAANGYVVAGDGLTATYTVTHQFTNAPCVDVCPAQLGTNLSTNTDKNGWTVPSEAEYVNDGIKLNVPGGWDSTYITRAFVGNLSDIGTAVDIDASPLQYAGIHIETSKGYLTYEEEASYGGKWWSNSDFGVASGMGYATFDTLENIAKANPDVTTSVVYVLYTHPNQSSSTFTSVTFGCVKYTFDKIEEEDKKVFVCKYVGTPGINERLQTGDNPISVSVNSIKPFNGVGSYFADAQGRSYVLSFDNTLPGPAGDPSVENCPQTGNRDLSFDYDETCTEKNKTEGEVSVEIENDGNAAANNLTVLLKNSAGNIIGTETDVDVPADDGVEVGFQGLALGTYTLYVYDGETLLSSQEVEVDECGGGFPDVCPDVPGIQTNRDDCGQVGGDNDVCPNIPSSQTTVPAGMVKDSRGNCVTDICPNLTGIQTTLPAGYTQVNGDCVLPVGGQGQVLGTTLPTTIPATGGTNLPNPLLSLVAGFLTYLFLARRNRRAEG